MGMASHSGIDRIALEHLCSAFQLYRTGSFLSALHLAGAADELWGKAVEAKTRAEQNGCSTAVYERASWMSLLETRLDLGVSEKLIQKFVDQLNAPRNAVKHPTGHSFDEQDEAADMLDRAITNYVKLKSEFPDLPGLADFWTRGVNVGGTSAAFSADDWPWRDTLAVRLQSAVDSFWRNDQTLLDFGVHERTVTHRLSIYLHEGIKPGWVVDCEYNRQGDGAPKTSLNAQVIPQTKARRRFPDIIVHQRGQVHRNALMIEAKSEFRSKEYSADKEKLLSLASEKGYKYGYFLTYRPRTRRKIPFLRLEPVWAPDDSSAPIIESSDPIS